VESRFLHPAKMVRSGRLHGAPGRGRSIGPYSAFFI
jgi:hypothetical protein